MYNTSIRLASTSENLEKKALVGGTNLIVNFSSIAKWNFVEKIGNKNLQSSEGIPEVTPTEPEIERNSLEREVFPKIDPMEVLKLLAIKIGELDW